MPSSGFQTCALDRKSTRLNSSHLVISYAVFCLKKQKETAYSVQVSAQHPDMQPVFSRFSRDCGAPYCIVRPMPLVTYLFFFNDTATTEIYTLSLHDALPIYDTFHDGLSADEGGFLAAFQD